MFLDCASQVLVAPPTTVIKLWLENHFFTFSTSSQKQPSGGSSYYARRLLKPRLIIVCSNYGETPPTGIFAEL